MRAITLISSSLILFMASPAAHARGGGPMLAKELGRLLMREMERLMSVF